MKRKLLIAAGVTIGLMITLLLVTASVWPVLNSVETGKTAEYPKALPLYFSADDQRVYTEVKASVEKLDRWTVASEDTESLVLKAERTSRLGFVDDIEIRVTAATEFVTVVHAKSQSRVGKGDFGQNARNIETIFGEMNQRLGAVKFDPKELSKK